jgi:uncharacterized membrane protein YdbT with pleckstrin-like domain
MSLSVDRPSQWLNFGYLITAIGTFFIHPLMGGIVLLVYLWKCVVLHYIKWNYENESIVCESGVFNVLTNEVEYFRIKDVILYRPLLYRLVGLSKIVLKTSDRTLPYVVLNGVTNGKRKRDMFRLFAKQYRKKEGVREFDFR